MNPARSLGPAVVIGNTGTEQIRSHLYIVQPKIEIVVPCSNVEKIHGIFADPVTSVGKLIQGVQEKLFFFKLTATHPSPISL